MRKIICINSVLMALLAACFLIYPPIRAALDLRDPALQGPGVPNAAWRLFRNLTPRYAAWAHKRVAQGGAENLSTNNISGTEWPLFGSVFYLWAAENLQDAWEAGNRSPGMEPKVFAGNAIIAASELVVDPKHASWVKKHWGADYLRRENVFYRMLVIAAITTRAKLLHDNAHLDRLRDQVESFCEELDASKSGLLDDYPGECYPGDVMAALRCIKRADSVLGTDHSKLLTRALRGFSGSRLTRHQLPPYSANSTTGLPTSDTRGSANSYMCITAPELWSAQAKQWYDLYDNLFWQKRITAEGFREFPRDVPHSDWTWDVDAGPVIAGHGVAASAFGIGATRKNGRFDRAYPLTAEMLATVGELPNGVLAIPRLLSNLSDAPMLGEAAILYQLSIQPQKGFRVKTGGGVPTYTYVVLISAFLLGVWRVLESIWTLKAVRHEPEPEIRVPRIQAALWVTLLLGSIATLATSHALVGLLLLLLGLMLPRVKKKKPPKGTEDWPEPNLPGTPPPPTQ